MVQRTILRCGAVAALVLFLLPAHAWSQNPTFNVEGVVTDAQQATLPGVAVTITNTATGLTRTVTTGENGRYVVRALPPEGQYRVQLEIAGFATQMRQNLVFNAGQNVVLNFAMQLSTVQETVTVSGDAPIVQTTSSEVSTTIDQKAFESLPVKERNYFRLLTLDSNVVATGTGSNAVNVGGQEVWNFGTYVDGTNNHSKWLTLQRAPQLGSSGFAIETVKQVQLITNQFSAEFGGHSAGVSSMITKTGTNQFSGSAFTMIRPGRSGRGPAAGADRQRREGQGAVQPAAVRRHGRRADRQGQAVLLRQLRAASRTQRGDDHGRRLTGADRARRRPTSTRATPRSTCASTSGSRSASATTWSAGTRTTKAADWRCRAPVSCGTTTSTPSTAPTRR